MAGDCLFVHLFWLHVCFFFFLGKKNAYESGPKDLIIIKKKIIIEIEAYVG